MKGAIQYVEASPTLQMSPLCFKAFVNDHSPLKSTRAWWELERSRCLGQWGALQSTHLTHFTQHTQLTIHKRNNFIFSKVCQCFTTRKKLSRVFLLNQLQTMTIKHNKVQVFLNDLVYSIYLVNKITPLNYQRVSDLHASSCRTPPTWRSHKMSTM